MIGKVALALGILYGAAVAGLALGQGALIFPRAMVGPAPSLPAGAETLRLATPQGDILHGIRLPGRVADAPVLLGFGGNAWNAAAMALFLHQLAPDHPVVAFHYRGYAPSTGRPMAAALLTDAVRVHDSLAAPDGVIAVGFSIGTGPAAHLARQRDLRGVVLVTPFDSLRQVAQQSFPWAPVRWLFRHDMDPQADLLARPTPVAVLTATRDEVIATARTDALLDALIAAGQPPVAVHRITAGHNSIYNHPDFAPLFRDALGAVIGAP